MAKGKLASLTEAERLRLQPLAHQICVAAISFHRGDRITSSVTRMVPKDKRLGEAWYELAQLALEFVNPL